MHWEELVKWKEPSVIVMNKYITSLNLQWATDELLVHFIWPIGDNRPSTGNDEALEVNKTLASELRL